VAQPLIIRLILKILFISLVVSFLATLTLESARAEAPAKELENEITDQTKDSNSVLIAPISIPKGKCSDYADMVAQYDWDYKTAMAVLKAESGCDSSIVNWGDNHKVCMGSAGLFQIGCVNASIEEMKNPKANIQKAYDLYSERGWQPWGAYTDGRYLQYL